LKTACALGDYLVRETLTPNSGQYPAFTRSTGKRSGFPLPPDAGSQGDRPYEIEPDKGGIAGHALMNLYRVSGRDEYRLQALHNARVLAAHQQAGDARQSPWPFRVDYRTGEARGPVSGNMTYILRLYDDLLAQGHEEFRGPRDGAVALDQVVSNSERRGRRRLVRAILRGSRDADQSRRVVAAESRAVLARAARAARSRLARGLRRTGGFVRKAFTHVELGVTVCHEQDEDPEAWGGINSTYGAVLALYAQAIGSAELADEARRALNFTLYSIDARGDVRATSAKAPTSAAGRRTRTRM
jgi:hypothetical protein